MYKEKEECNPVRESLKKKKEGKGKEVRGQVGEREGGKRDEGMSSGKEIAGVIVMMLTWIYSGKKEGMERSRRCQSQARFVNATPHTELEPL